MTEELWRKLDLRFSCQMKVQARSRGTTYEANSCQFGLKSRFVYQLLHRARTCVIYHVYDKVWNINGIIHDKERLSVLISKYIITLRLDHYSLQTAAHDNNHINHYSSCYGHLQWMYSTERFDRCSSLANEPGIYLPDDNDHCGIGHEQPCRNFSFSQRSGKLQWPNCGEDLHWTDLDVWILGRSSSVELSLSVHQNPDSQPSLVAKSSPPLFWLLLHARCYCQCLLEYLLIVKLS